MTWDQYLGFAAKDHTVAQGATSQTGHDSPDGSTMSQRVEKYGTYVGTLAENIAYGTTGGEEIVIALVIDDGVPSRGHRLTIFNDAVKVLGSFTGTHQTFSSMTTIDYAGGLTSNGDHPLTPNTEPACTFTSETSCSADSSCYWDGSACG